MFIQLKSTSRILDFYSIMEGKIQQSLINEEDANIYNHSCSMPELCIPMILILRFWLMSKSRRNPSVYSCSNRVKSILASCAYTSHERQHLLPSDHQINLVGVRFPKISVINLFHCLDTDETDRRTTLKSFNVNLTSGDHGTLNSLHSSVQAFNLTDCFHHCLTSSGDASYLLESKVMKSTLTELQIIPSQNGSFGNFERSNRSCPGESMAMLEIILYTYIGRKVEHFTSIREGDNEAFHEWTFKKYVPWTHPQVSTLNIPNIPNI